MASGTGLAADMAESHDGHLAEVIQPKRSNPLTHLKTAK
jgi:hypothetical protein